MSTQWEDQLRRMRQLLQRRIAALRATWQRETDENFQGAAIADAQVDRILAGEKPADEAPAIEDVVAPPRLAALVDAFALTPFERDVVMLLFAAELDPDFELLFGYVHDDVGRKYVSAHLAAALFGGDARAFSAEGTLRRFALVHVDPPPQAAMPLAMRPLRLDERVVDHLRGVDRLADVVAEMLRPIESGPLADEHARLAETLAGESAINLTGPSHSGKETLALAIATNAGRALHKLDPRRLPPLGAERNAAMKALEREARLMRLMYFVQAPERDAPDVNTEVALQDIVETLDAPFVVDTRDTWPGARKLAVARVARPDRNAQRILWTHALGDDAVTDLVDDLVEQFDFSPEMIARAARAVPREHGLSARALWDTCQQQVSWRIDDLAQRITTRQKWADLVLDADSTAQLHEIAHQVAQRARVYERWGFAARLTRGRGITALFAGASGTGKTMAAEIIAGELGLELYRIDLAGVVSKYIGESEKNLRRVFDAAEQSGSILFFDEADALFGKRTDVKDSHDLYANIQVNYLLQRMEDYRGLAILATNRKNALDRAFLRRLRFVIDFPFPEPASRERMWRNAFPADTPTAAFDYEFLARLEIAGGNIRNIALNAAFLAAADGGVVTERHVMHAVRREYAKMQKLVTENEFGPHYRELA